MEASALNPPAGLAHPRLPMPTALLRLRSDEQLVTLFRAGNEEAFRVIHDRYRARLFAYARQMLPGCRADAEDALQDVFVRAYRSLRTSDRELALRPWLYRVAHNRCIDEMRRPPTPAPELLETIRSHDADPLAAAERREDLRRLVTDLGRLPEQQRSALLMREIDGLPYADIAAALETSIPAVKSLLVRARMGLAQAGEARETACSDIRGQLTMARDRGVRASGQARRHLRDCAGCRAYRSELRLVERRLAVFVPSLGPAALAAKIFGLGGAASGGGAGVCTAGGAAGGAACTTSVAGGAIVAAAAGKVVVVAAVAAVAAGGAANVEHRLAQQPKPAHAAASAVAPAATSAPAAPSLQTPVIPTRSIVAAAHTAAARHRLAHKAVATPPAPPTRTVQPAQPVVPVTGEDPVATDPVVTDPAGEPTDPAADGTGATPTETDPAATGTTDPGGVISPDGTVPSGDGTTVTATTSSVGGVTATSGSTGSAPADSQTTTSPPH